MKLARNDLFLRGSFPEVMHSKYIMYMISIPRFLQTDIRTDL